MRTVIKFKDFWVARCYKANWIDIPSASVACVDESASSNKFNFVMDFLFTGIYGFFEVQKEINCGIELVWRFYGN